MTEALPSVSAAGSFFDQGVAAGHALHAEGHEDGGRRREAFGDDGNGEGNGGEELLMDGPAVEHARAEDEDTHRGPGEGESLPGGGELPLERGVRLFLFLDQSGDAPHLGPHARGDHEARAAAVDDRGGRVGHVGAVGQHSGVGQRVRVLFGRDGLARERGLLDAELRRVEQAEVRRNPVSVPEEYDITGDERLRRDHAFLALAEDACRRCGKAGQRGEGRLGLPLLHDADEGVQGDDGGDDRGLRPFAEKGGEKGGADEDQHHRVRTLLLQHGEEGFRRAGAERIGAVPFETGSGFRIRQAGGRGAEGGEAFIG